MPSEVVAVLLVPAEGDPHGLIAEGPCGARPPVAYRDLNRWTDDPPATVWPPAPFALVLAWEGKPVAEGIFRVSCNDTEYGIDDWILAVTYILTGIDNGVTLLEASEDFGAPVLLDADGNEVSP